MVRFEDLATNRLDQTSDVRRNKVTCLARLAPSFVVKKKKPREACKVLMHRNLSWTRTQICLLRMVSARHNKVTPTRMGEFAGSSFSSQNQCFNHLCTKQHNSLRNIRIVNIFVFSFFTNTEKIAEVKGDTESTRQTRVSLPVLVPLCRPVNFTHTGGTPPDERPGEAGRDDGHPGVRFEHHA